MIGLFAVGDRTKHESQSVDDAAISPLPTTSSPRCAMSGLLGRRRECAAVDKLLLEARSRRSATLVVTGEAGCGKSALLEYVRRTASDFHVLDCCGVESEMELVYAGVHQLCSSLLGPMDRLPQPQRLALHSALGMVATSEAQDRFLVGLAVLSLFAMKSAKQPLLCLVDDAQWLDQPSLQTLAFVARRLAAEPIAVVFGLREGAAVGDLTGLPALSLSGLGRADAHQLLASSVHAPLDEHVRDRIVAEAHGNPLALQELPRGWSPDRLAGGFVIPGASSLRTRIEHSFLRRVHALPPDTRLLLLAAAAEPVGDTSLLWRAAQQLGVRPEAAGAAEAAELIDFGARVRFRHPLARSAIYHAADPTDRRRVHRALALATDASTDPDRRAWHRAYGAIGPDEDVAEELERSAGRARARAGIAAAAAFHERAAELTIDPERRRTRYLTAAQSKLQAGAPEAAGDLLLTARSGPLPDLERARAELLGAQIGFAMDRGSQAPPLLLKAARRLEGLDPLLARDTYLDALSAAMFAGRLATGVTALDVAQAARTGPPAPRPPRPTDLLLDALAIRFTDGYAAAKVPLQRAVLAFADGHLAPENEIRRLWLACTCAAELWDDESWYTLTAQYVARVREAGALSELPLALSQRSAVLICTGQLAEVAALVDETRAVSDVTRSHLVPYGAVLLAAWRGDEADLERLAEASIREAVNRGEGIGVGVVQSALAVMHNSVGRHRNAMTAAAVASANPDDLVSSCWGLAELVEAAARAGDRDRARTALQSLSATTTASGTGWALGVEARCRALLTTGVGARELYQEAIDRLAGTRMRNDLARAHLLYGSWLQRAQRRTEARDHLRTAHDMFAGMGAEAWAERAARGLRAGGENVRRRSADTRAHLTSQEDQIAQLARDGLSNLEIGARLFLSSRTVEWHLGNVFAKLGITSRRELHRAFAG
ncbi:AAA family ATPase [Jatrophihabitans sp. DSM 45814]